MTAMKVQRDARVYEARVALAAFEADGRPGEHDGQWGSYVRWVGKVFDAIAAAGLVVAKRSGQDDELDRVADIFATMADGRHCAGTDEWCRTHGRPEPCPSAAAEAWLEDHGIESYAVAGRAS